MRPINANNALDNHHVYVCGMSGCGKTSAAKKLFIKSSDQVAIFDPLGDYHGELCNRVVRGYTKLRDFAAALIAGRKTNKSFKIAYQPNHETTPEDFDRFCRVVWGVGNGKRKPLKIICEEVAEHSLNAGKATGYHGKILRLGRKFNLHSINMFQRGQEVSKTIIDNCHFACIMMQKTVKSAIYLENMTGILATDINQLSKLEYLLQEGKPYKPGKIRW
ncbi:ATP-binding protein [Vibrio sp. SCSIO 43132]|uniref:type IV secretory system conjugative DNA transfer family protein n=1 Tax=Vibrio sp. SCSIO 43132 TaxID=2779363 RepID=UPI001CA9BBE5|nr:type IV secretory system conjugative DNA transfer family protein [Vibrio sp. SCSIO 43132]UAB72385.1 ATP-binding protein [Vibrio sp. SCSIO 43132]